MIAAYYYCDESGKSPKDHYVSFGGYIGAAPDWESLCSRWNDTLLKFDVPPIHVSKMNCPDDNRDWGAVKSRHKNNWPEVREQILDAFALLINKSAVKPIAVHVDSEEFAKMASVSSVFANPHYLAFVYCMRAAVTVLRGSSDGHAMGIVLDHDKETARNCFDLLSELRKQEPRTARYIASLCFVDDRQFPGVQAADMMLNLTRRSIEDGKIVPSARIKKLTTPDFQPRVAGKAFLAALEDDLNNQGEPR
jgi:hypothetical protein